MYIHIFYRKKLAEPETIYGKNCLHKSFLGKISIFRLSALEQFDFENVKLTKDLPPQILAVRIAVFALPAVKQRF